eukprot:CAMPEP_0170565902 /NCGR_PEP_ID=MMETSP0211-20121228/79481_1 /TAXON_ID=311385 /ORGANISM="Pseudokeronopsis sp., Strain OXSARD2" /LENGTH=108 /DNA_ID=CAMNT_0010886897 /DNA_START=90 /DNA_END=416 /DNA_ORIENTATION=-
MEKIQKAYSRHGGVGALCISDIPNWAELNKRVSDYAYKMNYMSREEKETCMKAEVKYMIGYGEGSVSADGVPDLKSSNYWVVPLHENFPLWGTKEPQNNIWPKNFPEF